MLPADVTLLAIESSCDDTAAAVLREGRVMSSVVASQRIHEGFGGVVPELASRAHQRLIVPTIEAALDEAACKKEELEAIAVTYGPGLAGSLLVGLSFAKALALGLEIPLIGVNHLEGHIYSVFIDEPHPEFPYLCLTVSGGHTLLTLVKEGFVHEELGRTRDDAAGEAFDKVAKILGLGYPGGPAIDHLAGEGDPNFRSFPSPRLPNENHRKSYTFSFSGIKTNVLYFLRDLGETGREEMLRDHLPDIAASFQTTVVDALVGAVRDAVAETRVKHVAIVGGVSANIQLRESAQEAAQEDGFELFVPALKHSVDNAAMIAVSGAFKLKAGLRSNLALTAEPSLAL